MLVLRGLDNLGSGRQSQPHMRQHHGMRCLRLNFATRLQW